MRFALALLLPAVLAGVSGCTDIADSVGKNMANLGLINVDHWALQPNEPVMINGKRFLMSGQDRCPSIWPLSSSLQECLALSADRQIVPVILRSDDGVSQALLVSAYADGRFTLNTLQGVPLLSAR
ncbi:hypothetical protein [Pseudomonas amygdali]|uniref:Lipoprotein n=2 Tax=Pseudomonas amygdali pv. lachrymans TaxID=53707 RepID=A0ABR5KQG2_PSEAV|nr:hypothetical protein [Pseudomonas amygdali]AXH59631.1 hypothetical protein PLA107_030880 [Pseudomonas amygdali pv. lachrymans str. M301315]KPC17061.1 Uncharacterized protein AC499_0263 [Pseudomonas amygdali pv. lachrymans]KPC18020.1 Uncharacterized protein AC499_1222 [Pseudomonas amygdali pv. lachrymans]RMT06528.1 hypothetical protein ALP54_03549 [Pseudomonas amygdali pv. lachrymans]